MLYARLFFFQIYFARNSSFPEWDQLYEALIARMHFDGERIGTRPKLPDSELSISPHHRRDFKVIKIAIGK